jgi:Domain of unknown function DUF29
MTTPSYDTDFYAWTQAQAEALRTKDVAALDLENLAEEIESLGKRDRRTVHGHLKVLLIHLLKWAAQLGRRCDGLLAVHGYAAVQQDACETFVNEYDRLLPELKTAAKGAENLPPLGPDMDRLMTSFEAAAKVTQHILFLGQAEINTLKQRKGVKRAPR